MKPTSLRCLAAVLCLVVLSAAPLYLSAQQAQPEKPSNSSTLGFTPRVTSFPNILAPYYSPSVPQEALSNSRRLHLLIQNGKLELSLDDAIALALENNLDIAVARYNLPLSQADYLRSKAGAAVRGVTGTGAFISNALFANAIGDPRVRQRGHR